MGYRGYKDLKVYQKAFEMAMDIFWLTKQFPKEERYSLTDQIRRSARSVGSNIVESWAKRVYIKSFVAKLVDSQSEADETVYWLDIALACKYMEKEKYDKSIEKINEVQRMLTSMIKNPEKFCHKPKL
ncbi:MAG: four helix bundle protein [Bacteroidales bacterium]|nr:four helix bundle protein [Bacteroidales bacterium]MCF8328515.1 four helix bundle protein [Bacteroidales bacterium]